MSGRGLPGHRASQVAAVTADTAASDHQHMPAGPDAVAELRALRQAYVRLLESGRDRIRDLGGDCDPVDVMERSDIALHRADAAIAGLIQKGEPAAWKSPFGSCVCNGKHVCPGCNPDEAIKLATEIATADERRKHPPCLECGATSAKDAETKCACSGDKDDCHGCELWPDGDDEDQQVQRHAERYRWLRDRMAVEDIPREHPNWSAPSEHESRKVDAEIDARITAKKREKTYG